MRQKSIKLSALRVIFEIVYSLKFILSAFKRYPNYQTVLIRYKSRCKVMMKLYKNFNNYVIFNYFFENSLYTTQWGTAVWESSYLEHSSDNLEGGKFEFINLIKPALINQALNPMYTNCKSWAFEKKSPKKVMKCYGREGVIAKRPHS